MDYNITVNPKVLWGIRNCPMNAQCSIEAFGIGAPATNPDRSRLNMSPRLQIAD
jgi:hypothetical protein